MKRAAKFGWIVLLGLVSGALAQGFPAEPDPSDIRIVSSFVADGEPVPAECRQQAHDFAESLVRYPRPDSWHWVLLCDEAGWRRFLRLSGRAERDAIYASTDIEDRTTYLRGGKLLYPSDLGVQMDTVVAHELAHIQLQGGEESAAGRLAGVWLRSLNRSKWDTLAGENTGN